METTARDELAQWVRNKAKDQPEISMPELTSLAVDTFRQDATWIDRFFEEAIRPMVYLIVRRVFAEGRLAPPAEVEDVPVVAPKGSLMFEGKPVTREEFKEIVDLRWGKKFEDWWETVAPGKTVRFLEMTQPLLRLAAISRRKQADPHLRAAALYDRLADRVPEGKTVRDVFTPEELQQVVSEYETEQPMPEAVA